ncbi:MAG: DUF1189 domain-containing protein [Victivallales bacterium]|nr:DUF1189 domain-containing protein [Victivallales bacterium]
MGKNSFFKILASVCTGTKLFDEISKHSVFRTLWHLILIALLLSAVFVLVRTPELSSDISDVNTFLQEEFGSVVVKSDGVYPEINPEKPRNINYDFTEIGYYPSLPNKQNLELNNKLNDRGFVWTPKGITGWIKMTPEKYVVYQGLASNKSPQWFNMTDKKGLYPYIKNNRLKSFNNLYTCLCAPLSGDIPLFMLLSPIKKGNNYFSDFSSNIYWYSSIMTGLKFVLMIFFNALFYSLLFALFFSITGRRDPQRDFTFKTAFNTAIYAGFPAMIIGIVFTISKMPWLDYQTIYLLTMFVYLIVIMQGKRKKEFNGKK